eukprot:m.60406 g.60406  ORF g.60406 m.60406 type:complete len:81 (+) comp17437_c0_seq2:511-753(+)
MVMPIYTCNRFDGVLPSIIMLTKPPPPSHDSPKTHLYVKLQQGSPPSKRIQRLKRDEWQRLQREKLLAKPPRVRHSLETY